MSHSNLTLEKYLHQLRSSRRIYSDKYPCFLDSNRLKRSTKDFRDADRFQRDLSTLVDIAGKVNKYKKGLTEKQYALVCKLLDKHKDLLGDTAEIVNNLEYPVIYVNREKWIDVDRVDFENEFGIPVIKVRAVFDRKNSDFWSNVKLHCKNLFIGSDSNDSALRYYRFDEAKFMVILKLAEDFDVKISESAQEVHNKIKKFKRQEDYVPGIYNLKLENVNKEAEKMLREEVGELNKKNYIKYCDRALKYGLTNYDSNIALESSNYYEHPDLMSSIALRGKPSYHLFRGSESLPPNNLFSKSNVFKGDERIASLKDIFQCIKDLDRLPMLVAVDTQNLQRNSDVNDLKELLDNLLVSFGRDNISVLSRPENQSQNDKKLNKVLQQTTSSDIKTSNVFVVDPKEIKQKIQLLEKINWHPRCVFLENRLPFSYHNFSLFLQNQDLIFYT